LPRYGRRERARERARGGGGFSSLMKQKIKGKKYAVFCFAGYFFIYIYGVIMKQKIYKRSTNNYSCIVIPDSHWCWQRREELES
jgi:hypothetical protein